MLDDFLWTVFLRILCCNYKWTLWRGRIKKIFLCLFLKESVHEIIISISWRQIKSHNEKRTELSFEKTTALSKLFQKYPSDTATKTIKIMKENKKEVITIFLMRLINFLPKNISFTTHVSPSIRSFVQKPRRFFLFFFEKPNFIPND